MRLIVGVYMHTLRLEYQLCWHGAACIKLYAVTGSNTVEFTDVLI